MTTQLLTFPKFPTKNTSLSQTDTPTFLISNLYTLTFHPGSSFLYHYTIQTSPEIAKDNHPLLQRLKHLISAELTTTFTKYISLGYSLYTPTSTAPSILTIPTTHHHVNYTITFQKLNTPPINLNNINESSPHIVKTIIETIMKNIIYANNNILRFHSGSFYKHNESQFIPGDKGILLPGFTTSVQLRRNNKLFYLINTNNKYISGISAYDQLQRIRSTYHGELFYQKCKEEFIGKSFLAKYGAYRVYKVDDITFDKNCINTEITMCDKDGKQLTMSIKHYYKLQYDIDIKDKQQPLFIKHYNNNNNNNRNDCCCYLIPELLFMCGNNNKNNNNEYKKRITTPKEKILKIQDIQLLLNNTNSKNKKSKSPYDIKREWGIQLHECYAFKSRILLSPNLHFANTVLTNDNNSSNNSNSSNKTLYQYQQLINTNNGFTKCNWICITYFHNESKCVSIISNMITASKRLNVHIEQPHIYALNTNNFINELKDIKLHKQLQLVLIVLCNKYSYLYKDIKHYFNMKGVPSQCIIDEKAKTLSYSTKVLTQMVCKINGELFRILLDNNLNSKVSMIIGIDVIRSGNNTYERVCITSTYNQFHSKVNVEVDVVKNSKEMTIVSLISKSLEHFKKVNKKLPSIILMYRKGGNDIQNEKLLHSEIPFIVDLFNGKNGKNCYMKDYTPLICVIAVNTKTDLKFFQQCPTHNNINMKCNSTNMYTNPEKGTVIDDDIIINSNRFEFYLQSQYVNQGTASPVHFTVLYDTTNIPLEVLENITYKQTYYYWNWNGSIRIPAILKYAEVCNTYLTTCSSGNNSSGNTITTINDVLKDRPFYL